MKKNLFYFLLLMAIGVMPLTSCDKENEPQNEPEQEDQHDPTSDSDQVKVTGYDALSWLQGALVVVDEQGEVVRRVYGKPLDASQPDVISVPVVGYIAAEKLFLDWVAPTKEATRVEGGYDYALTDAEGKAQGSVSFRAVEGEAGVLARMTVNDDTDLKHISEVQFVDYDFWPENDDIERVEVGNIYWREDVVLTWTWGYFENECHVTKKNLPFYCMQSNTDGNEGILVWLCPDTNNKWEHQMPTYYRSTEAWKYLSSEYEGEKVLEIFLNNKPVWDKMLKDMDAKGYQWSPQDGGGCTGNSEFLLRQYDGYRYMLCLDLDDGDGYKEWIMCSSLYKYRYIHIEIIPAVK